MKPDRRQVLRAAAAAAVAGVVPSAQARPRHPVATPAQTAGPFHPSAALLARRVGAALDHDLTRVGDRRADGLRIALHGVVRDVAGTPLPKARVEIWQTCHRGRYLHAGDDFGSEIPQDPGFAYWGVDTTDDAGAYALLTVMPRRYPSGGQREWWRPPHVHLRVRVDGATRLTTQLYFDDPTDPDNDWRHQAVQAEDRILGGVPGPRRGELVVGLRPVGEDGFEPAGLERAIDEHDRVWGMPRLGRFDPIVHPPGIDWGREDRERD